MSAEAVDRRVRKTRKQLRECLISLLKQKKVQDITVRELTDMADLNRGTFYLHYKDVYDLLENCDVYRQIAQSQLSEDELNDGKSGESKLPGETGKPIETGKPSVESELNESEGR